MNVVDSSAWLEYFADGPNADYFAPPIEDTKSLIVPTISVLEVFKVILRERGEDDALQATALLRQGQIADLSEDIAIQAATLGHDHKLPLADSVIYATAQKYKAQLWTQDEHFKDLPGVNYKEKIKPARSSDAP